MKKNFFVTYVSYGIISSGIKYFLENMVKLFVLKNNQKINSALAMYFWYKELRKNEKFWISSIF